MASPTLQCLMLLCYLSSLFILPSSSFPITLQLSRKTHSSKNPKDLISEIAKATLNRAYHLRHHNNNKHPSTSTPLYPISSLSEYVIFISLGTPPQKLPVIFDTGSSFVWVPCTSNYLCRNCTQPKANIAVFKPKRSSSKQSVNCSNKKCSWLDMPGSIGSCPGCSTCHRPCAYNQAYVTGTTLGHAISDNLNLQGKVVPDFFFGCSSYSYLWSKGIVGFGRNPMSLPNQINLTKFSYCLVSHKFDDTSKSSRLILGDSGDVQGMKYTPLLKNPSIEPYNQFYYVHLERITIGKKVVKLPQEINLVPDSNGDGGTIVDSGSTWTLIDSGLFNPIIKEFTAQLTPAQRRGVENDVLVSLGGGNIFCVNVTPRGLQRLDFPEIVFHFKGNVKMDMGVANYFNNGGNQWCLPFVNSTTSIAPGGGGYGPAMILGNYQQFDFRLEFDLKKQRLGVKRQNCDLI